MQLKLNIKILIRLSYYYLCQQFKKTFYSTLLKQGFIKLVLFYNLTIVLQQMQRL